MTVLLDSCIRSQHGSIILNSGNWQEQLLMTKCTVMHAGVIN